MCEMAEIGYAWGGGEGVKRQKTEREDDLPTKVFMSRTQWNVSIWEKVEMSIGKLLLGNTTPNISFLFFRLLAAEAGKLSMKKEDS